MIDIIKNRKVLYFGIGILLGLILLLVLIFKVISESGYVVDTGVKYTQKDFVRQTNVSLIEESFCGGDKNSSLRATINESNDIILSQGKNKDNIMPGNVKYLYNVSIVPCEDVALYYITDDNHLYVLEDPGFNNKEAVKASSNSVVEFLGTETKNDNNYLKVLLKSGNVEYIDYINNSK